MKKQYNRPVTLVNITTKQT